MENLDRRNNPFILQAEMDFCRSYSNSIPINVNPFSSVMASQGQNQNPPPSIHNNLPLTNNFSNNKNSFFFPIHGCSEEDEDDDEDDDQLAANTNPRNFNFHNNNNNTYSYEFIQQISSSSSSFKKLMVTPTTPIPANNPGCFADGEHVNSGDNNPAGSYGQILSTGRNNPDPNMDPKKLKRIISNRVSAQKSRLKKVQYVADMERKLKALEAHVAVLSPQVELYRNQQRLLQIEQKTLNQKIINFSRNKLLKDVEIEENKAEVSRLRQLHLKLQKKKEEQAGATVSADHQVENEVEANNDAIIGFAEWETTTLEQSENQEMMMMINQSELGNTNMAFSNSNHLQVAENAEMTGGGNGSTRINLIAQNRMVEYKWMPTPGLRQVIRPTSNQEMEKPN